MSMVSWVNAYEYRCSQCGNTWTDIYDGVEQTLISNRKTTCNECSLKYGFRKVIGIVRVLEKEPKKRKPKK
jgi:predicted nucleic acid-binding Zn ribbon protein